MHACLTIYEIKEGHENWDRKGIYKLTKGHKGERGYTYLLDVVGIWIPVTATGSG